MSTERKQSAERSVQRQRVNSMSSAPCTIDRDRTRIGCSGSTESITPFRGRLVPEVYMSRPEGVVGDQVLNGGVLRVIQPSTSSQPAAGAMQDRPIATEPVAGPAETSTCRRSREPSS